jgi:hypothetical protein
VLPKLANGLTKHVPPAPLRPILDEQLLSVCGLQMIKNLAKHGTTEWAVEEGGNIPFGEPQRM